MRLRYGIDLELYTGINFLIFIIYNIPGLGDMWQSISFAKMK